MVKTTIKKSKYLKKWDNFAKYEIIALRSALIDSHALSHENQQAHPVIETLLISINKHIEQ